MVAARWTGMGLLVAAAWCGIAAAPASAAPVPLIGTFTITAGNCSGGSVSGTYLRMVLSGGTNSAGPFFSNSDSTCSDDTYTPLPPGSAGGLTSGSYQPEPSPAFDSSGNALAHRITAPVPFEGVKFATATNPVDPQTGLQVPAPTIVADGTTLSGNLEAFGVSSNNQQFNQGSPKPGGASPGNTTPVTGTYSPTTGAYTLQWSSQIVGGPFNGFSAFWNLTGRFIPSSGSSTAPTGSGSPGPVSSPSTSGPGHTQTVPATNGAPTDSQAAPTGTSTTTTTPATAHAVTPGIAKSRIVLSSHTTSTVRGGWDTPLWVVALIAVLAVLGLGGVAWSEGVRRKQGAAS